MWKTKFATICYLAIFHFVLLGSGAHAANVAIIDSGIKSIGSINASTRDVLGEWDYVYGDWFPYDWHGHGTKVALAFLSYAQGIPEAAPRITSLRVADALGNLHATPYWWALKDAAGLVNNWSRLAAGGPLSLTGSYKIDIVNLSLGGGQLCWMGACRIE